MKQSKIQFLQEVLVTQLNFLTFFPLAMMVSVMLSTWFTPVKPRLWAWMLGGLVCFGMYLVRRYVHNFILFVLLHIVALAAMGGVAFLLANPFHPVHLVVFGVSAVGFIIYSVYLRFKTEDFRDESFKLLFTIGVFVAALLFERLLEGPDWGVSHVLVLILCIVIYYINYYLDQYCDFVRVNTGSTGVLPEKAIFRSGMSLSLGYIGLGAAVLMLVPGFEWLRPVLAWLKNALIYLLRFLFSLFGQGEDVPESVEESKPTPGPQDSGMPDMSGAETWIGWKILEVIFVGACIIGFLYALYRFVRWLIAKIRSTMARRADAAREQVGDVTDVREELEPDKDLGRKKGKTGFFGFLDAGERIRRLYKKKTAAYMPRPLQEEQAGRRKFRRELLPFFTAREMGLEMENAVMAELYEKARYSAESCTAQDVKRMKEVCKN